MKNLKYVVAIAALFGLLGIFVLPYIEGIKLWTLHSDESVSSQIYIALFCYVAALLVVGVAVLRGAMTRAFGIVALILFLLTLAVGAVHEGFHEGIAIGGKVLLLSAILGLVSSLLVVIKPERKLA